MDLAHDDIENREGALKALSRFLVPGDQASGTLGILVPEADTKSMSPFGDMDFGMMISKTGRAP